MCADVYEFQGHEYEYAHELNNIRLRLAYCTLYNKVLLDTAYRDWSLTSTYRALGFDELKIEKSRNRDAVVRGRESLTTPSLLSIWQRDPCGPVISEYFSGSR